MSNDLISRKALNDDLIKLFQEIDDMYIAGRVIGLLLVQPTAYDPDKVVEHLEEMHKGFCEDEGSELCCVDYCRRFETCIRCFHERALEIVKKGGAV